MKMPIDRHLGTPNSSFSFASLDVIECVVQYYTDQWGGGGGGEGLNKSTFKCQFLVFVGAADIIF